MTLREKQSEFALAVAQLILWAHHEGYEVTFGHATRCPECPVGSPSSLHKSRLAIDLNLFRNGHYLKTTEDHRPLGEFWESLGGAWGGRFSNPDGNHYSFPHDGRM